MNMHRHTLQQSPRGFKPSCQQASGPLRPQRRLEADIRHRSFYLHRLEKVHTQASLLESDISAAAGSACSQPAAVLNFLLPTKKKKENTLFCAKH
ncbi:hypothetical protein INR49_019309 [Caranx melampygus]|nr:hypothetical protein INR49_019309 [Caranx melampygus]